MRRQIERMAAKMEKRLDEVQTATSRVQREVSSVREDSARVSALQEEQMDLVRSFADTRLREVDRYTRMLDDSKLDILSRMDAERLQMERVLQQRLSDLHMQISTDQTALLREMQAALRAPKMPVPTPAPPSTLPTVTAAATTPTLSTPTSSARFPLPWPQPPGPRPRSASPSPVPPRVERADSPRK
ncbi:uncharacterized protein LOC143287456 [Babylonia areolata]